MKYQKYKDFLPEDIRLNKLDKINKSNKRAMFWILILNSILLPLNLSKKNCDDDIEVFNEENMYNYENKIESIKEWININEDYYINISVENEDGEIYLKERQFAYEIEKDGFYVKEYRTIEDDMIIKVVKR
ncbi:Uncharacterised protein [uncultured Clostridium sp.]|uniref:hypothetical protein n=1 Tax=uncultured Clostridium sp. TaxID=59620 RepID=UPI00082025D4|nr:hypothetical protein [uncultured Clostridium sp.]SCJ54569.1 Uncharacterised protein [uncultured Clostridium sp.]